LGVTDSQALTFSDGVWWSWRHRNLMCLNNKTWSFSRLSFNIRTMVETFKNCFWGAFNDEIVNRYIKLNNNNYSCVILNVDGSCLSSPIRSGLGGIIRNTFGQYLAGFLGFLGSIWYFTRWTVCYLQWPLVGQRHGYWRTCLLLYSLQCVNLIKDPQIKYHIYVVLIQEILSQTNVSFYHTFREENQYADLFA
jgi:hypothetical protein